MATPLHRPQKKQYTSCEQNKTPSSSLQINNSTDTTASKPVPIHYYTNHWFCWSFYCIGNGNNIYDYVVSAYNITHRLILFFNTQSTKRGFTKIILHYTLHWRGIHDKMESHMRCVQTRALFLSLDKSDGMSWLVRTISSFCYDRVSIVWWWNIVRVFDEFNIPATNNGVESRTIMNMIGAFVI